MEVNVKTINKSFEVHGESKKDKKDAITIAFRNLQNLVFQQETNAILYMKPVDVKVIDYKEESRIEKFLFVFFPKERKQISVKLKIEVEMTILEI